ncbi:MAG: peptidase U32 family protein [Kiritimatiellia bacterium]
MNKKPTELMAPAGSYDSLSAAIRAGADSVYFGIDRLNMRARAASPFTLGDLRKIARICRRCRVRSYLALNTILYDEDIESVREICAAAKEAGISAVIAGDIAAIRIARDTGLEVHISVQANISNMEAVRFYAQYADVLVLARELTLDQISAISRKMKSEKIKGPSGQPVQIELFAHGALCVAVSGKCYMSLAQYNTSANRGACYQTCRRKYLLSDAETGEELIVDNQFIMSPKDLCTVQYLDQLLGAGVSILKIEGRGRTADYVATVTAVYREALDAWRDGKWTKELGAVWMARLESVFNRGFWDGGYYCGEKLGEWSGRGNSQASVKRVQIGLVEHFYGAPKVMQFTMMQRELKSGDVVLVEGPTTGALRQAVGEIRVDGKPAATAVKGDVVTMGMPAKVRLKDKVYLHVRPADDDEKESLNEKGGKCSMPQTEDVQRGL